MATTTSNSQNATVGTSASPLHWDIYYTWLEVVNLGTAAVWATTDGSTATASETGADVIPPGTTVLLPNRQPDQDAVTSAAGSTDQQVTVPASGHLTFISLISGSAGQNVVVSPQ